MLPLFSIIPIIILIIIPTLIYALIYALKCPENIFRRSSGETSGESKTGITYHTDMVSTVKYEKKTSSSEDSGNECPVCLTAFVEGEEVRQLKTCKHMYHFSCIDKWLCSKSSCPVCRASVPLKRPKRPAVNFDDDFRQGLPDASSLV
ncbi:hypothetical protein RND71_031282 [Anisodus tanguticus]|uniref:RING-type domain-containing protein n=1 Tax=Anisodus tanguticus TaxID=243964 RepID=A0AAE1RDB7_9SOLA|nr:hypothetical protein RND71_031282 [Anisodus tanguticus]